jgi:hypothetical protein
MDAYRDETNLGLTEADLVQIIPKNALQRFHVNGKQILHIETRCASPRWGYHLLDRARALEDCRNYAGSALNQLLDKMILDKQVRCFFLLNPRSILDEFVEMCRPKNIQRLRSELLTPIGSLDEAGLIEYLYIGCVLPNALDLSAYEHPLSIRMRENRIRAISVLTLVLMKEMSYVAGLSDADEYNMLNQEIAINISRNDARKAFGVVDDKYHRDDLHKTLGKLRSCDVLEPLPDHQDLYKMNPYILDLWSRGMILELFAQKCLLKKVPSTDMVLCPLVLSYSRVVGNEPEPKYDHLTGFHELDLLFKFRENLYFMECKNHPCNLVRMQPQYDGKVKFLGKISDVERYYGISSRKILVQTNNLHEALRDDPREDLRVYDRGSIVSNLEDALDWLER